ncbi:hypothetical protein MAHJHV51_57130 [Mycobacterium avium subsp. hominissuis]
MGAQCPETSTLWAAVAAAHNVDVSGHCAPNLHAHVATAVANLRRQRAVEEHLLDAVVVVEVLQVPQVGDGALSPQGGVLRPDQQRPGFGPEFKQRDADQYRMR